jgi:hypothetical protein
MVEDMKKNGKDPLRYFESHQEQTSDILNMSFKKATLLAQQYKANMEQCGQLMVPKDGKTTTPIDDKLSEETQKQQTKAVEANLIQFLSCFCTSNNKSRTIRVQSHISDTPTLVCMARGGAFVLWTSHEESFADTASSHLFKFSVGEYFFWVMNVDSVVLTASRWLGQAKNTCVILPSTFSTEFVVALLQSLVGETGQPCIHFSCSSTFFHRENSKILQNHT